MRKSCYYIFFFAFGMMLFAFRSEAQQLKLGNNPTQINPASVLELQSYNQGLRLTRADTNAVNEIIAGLSPALQDSTNGMVIFQTSDSSIYYRAGGHWRKLAITDSVGIQSLNGDKSRIQSVKLVTGANNYATPVLVDSTNGNHYLFLPFASSAYTGIVNTGAQTFGGPKTFANTLILGQDLIANGSSGIDGQVLRSSGAGISPRWENMLLDSLYNVKMTYPVNNGSILQYNGTKWVDSSGNGTFWMLTGNSGTDSTKNFLGTTDNIPLIFKVGSPPAPVGYFGTATTGYRLTLGTGTTSSGFAAVAIGSRANSSGDYATAIGYSAAANQANAIAIGNTATAQNTTGTAIGYIATASGSNAATALGYLATAGNGYATALGAAANSSGASAIALGRQANASGSSAIAIGNSPKASGATTIAIGYQSSASATNSLGIGYNSTASGSNGISLGTSTTASANQSTALGYQSKASATNATAIGSNAYAWNPNTLILGDTINNIKVGIGTNNPAYNLEVNGMGKFDTTLYLGRDLSTNGSSGIIGQALISQGLGVSPQWQNITNGTVTNVTGTAPIIVTNGTTTPNISITQAGSSSNGYLSSTDWNTFNTKWNGATNLITSPAIGDVLAYNGTNWVNSSGNGAFWTLKGNSGINPATNFLGTTDNNALKFRVNNQPAGYLGIADSSTSFGINSSISTQWATAIGASSSATNSYATALGYNASAGYQFATAVGGNSKAGNSDATALGYKSSAGFQYSTVIGSNAIAGNSNATAIGYKSSANAQYATALGSNAASAGNYSNALGNGASVSGNYSNALGFGASVSGSYSTAIGYNATTAQSNTIVLGNGAKVGVNTSTPTNTLTINSPTANTSGLQFTQLNSASPPTSSTGLIGVDGSGNVIRVAGVVNRKFTLYNPSGPSPAISTPPPALSGPVQFSTLYDTYVTYSFNLSYEFSKAGTAEADLQISPTGASGSWITISTVNFNNYGGGTGKTVSETSVISGWVPKNYYVQIITSTSGTGSVSFVNGEEVSMQ